MNARQNLKGFLFSGFKSRNVFSLPWNDSDVVLVVEDEQFHVHRYILSLQSPVFKAMLNGNFKDAQQDKIELKDDKYEAMIQFLKLLYPPTMFDDDKGKVDIDDGNILGILQLADKYGTMNLIKQCIKKAGFLKPENAMRLLPYAARHDLPQEDILKVIGNDISTKVLENYAPELGDDALYIQTLVSKCHSLEKLAAQAYTMILFLLDRHVKNTKMKDRPAIKCGIHGTLNAESFQKARKCISCMNVYEKCLVDKCVFQHDSDILHIIGFKGTSFTRKDVVSLLTVLDNIESASKL